MKICSKCGDEFRNEVEDCVSCKIPLVYPEQLTGEGAKRSIQEQLADKTLVSLTEGPLATCREIERLLLSAEIPVLLAALRDDIPQNLGSAQVMRYALKIAEEDIPKAAMVLEMQFAHMVAKEGTGSLALDAVDLSLTEVTCPACGYVGALVNGQCVECELFLGEPG